MTRVSIHLPRRRDCARVARRWVAEQLGGDSGGSTRDDLQLVVTELVNNAYVHGEGQITLFLERSAGSVRVEVVDEGEGAVLEICEHKRYKPGGHGLRLVDSLAQRWGAFEGTTHVWAEIPV